MDSPLPHLATLPEMVGVWEIFESEVPGLVTGTEVYEFRPDGTVTVLMSAECPPARINARLLPQSDGFDVQFSSGKIYTRWTFTWRGEYLQLSHTLHSYRSLLRRVGAG